ncbi:MAG: peptide chain release factor N(5)-glutamine methyltransferase [Christensenellales bacterium]
MIFFPVVKGSAVSHKNNRAIATINDKGKIDVISFKDKKDFWGLNIPFFRGLSLLIFGIYLFIISLNRSQLVLGKSNKEEFEEKIAKNLKVSKSVVTLTICGFLGALIGFVGLILIPYFFFSMLRDEGLGLYLVAFIMGIIRVAFLMIILLSLRFIPSMRQFYRNNGAGNLAKANYEKKKIDTYYLSTNFLNFIICGFFLSIFVVSFIVAEMNFLFRFLINIAIIIVSFSVVYEILKLLEFKNSLFSKILIIPVAFLTCEIPGQTERELAFSAMNEVLLMIENEERLIGNTVFGGVALSVVYSEVKQRLSAVGIEDEAEADWLIANALGKNRSEIKLLTHISEAEQRKIRNALSKREKHMPISKIFNQANFYGRDFYVDKNVLSPRQETELVVEEAIKELKKFQKPQVLDLMTGSGVIAITIAKETSANVVASDISHQALEVAKKNAKTNNAKIKFVESDIFKGLKKDKFDLIISNPPYIPSKEVLTLDDEVKKYDPILALDGGDDGLSFYREIAEQAPMHLKEDGIIVLEIGFNQGQSIKKLLQNSFKNIKIKKDYSGNDRIVVAQKK